MMHSVPTGRRVNDKPVDAAALLFNKQPLEGMHGLKRYLLAGKTGPICPGDGPEDDHLCPRSATLFFRSCRGWKS